MHWRIQALIAGCVAFAGSVGMLTGCSGGGASASMTAPSAAESSAVAQGTATNSALNQWWNGGGGAVAQALAGAQATFVMHYNDRSVDNETWLRTFLPQDAAAVTGAVNRAEAFSPMPDPNAEFLWNAYLVDEQNEAAQLQVATTLDQQGVSNSNAEQAAQYGNNAHDQLVKLADLVPQFVPLAAFAEQQTPP